MPNEDPPSTKEHPSSGEGASPPNDKGLDPIDLTASDISPQLDITVVPPGGEVQADEIPTHSRAWAGVVRPFTFFIFWLLAAVILLPFLFVFIAESESRDIAYDWAKTVLAPIVGFASAAIGYYYGTRQAGPTADSSESVEAQPNDK